MSTPLIVLAVILAVFALGLIPLMMAKGSQQQRAGYQRDHGKSHHKKKKKR